MEFWSFKIVLIDMTLPDLEMHTSFLQVSKFFKRKSCWGFEWRNILLFD